MAALGAIQGGALGAAQDGALGATQGGALGAIQDGALGTNHGGALCPRQCNRVTTQGGAPTKEAFWSRADARRRRGTCEAHGHCCEYLPVSLSSVIQ